MQHEWVILANLFLLLMGFALLSRHFEKSKRARRHAGLSARRLEGRRRAAGDRGVLSSFLDNIAAALIGGTMARHVFRGKVHIGYLAAIVAASNAGGAGSVVGDTTTTMMWIDGVSPLSVLEAYVAVLAGFAFFAIPAAVAAAPLFADRQGGALRPRNRMASGRHRRRDPRSSRSSPMSLQT